MSITTAENLVSVADPDKKTSSQIMEIFRKSLTYGVRRRNGYSEYEKFFLLWEQLDEQDYGNHRVEIKFATRFCRTHATYVLKDRPNIQVPPINPNLPESKYQASRIEFGLNTWWDDQNIVQKLKRGVLTACYKWDFVWFLNVNQDQKLISLHPLQPDLFDYDRVSTDPDSPYLWVLRVEMMNTDELKKKFVSKADLITPSWLNTRFLTYTNFISSDLYNLYRTAYIELMDHKYLYKYCNDVEVEVIEHHYPFIPYYHLQYFDVGGKWGMALMDFIKDPVKKMNQIIGYQFDQALKVSNPPLVIIGGNANINEDNLKGGKISIPTIGATVQYLQPPMSNMQMDKMADMMKQYAHFLGAMNEEAMAWFTGALTSAGVSIELRMDSTVREAVDVQIGLQKIIQTMNADYLKLFEKFFPGEDITESKVYGKLSDVPYEGKLINKYYRNIVDFGGVLPKSSTDVVRNVMAKYNGGMISLDTALEEMRYMDPTTEKEKIRSEKIEAANLAKQIETGNVEQKYFDNPKAEEDFMLTQNKMAMPHPNQDHAAYIKSHMARYQQVPSPLLLQNILIRKQMMGQATPLPNPPGQQNTWFVPGGGAPQEGGQPPMQQQAPQQPSNFQ